MRVKGDFDLKGVNSTEIYRGKLPDPGKEGVNYKLIEGTPGYQQNLFEKKEPEWVEIDVKGVRVEDVVEFGGPWLGLELIHWLGLDQFFLEHVAGGREEIPWALMAEVLALSRLCHPSIELHIAEHFFEQTALADLLGIPSDKINEDRLYRALDQILPHKDSPFP